MKKIGVLLPAYNEEDNISAVVRETKRFLPDAMVVVVDDGSADETAKIARKEGVFVVSHKKNMGKGEAMKTGFKVFSKKFKNIRYILVADADRQYNIREAKNLLAPLLKNEADFVMGYRVFSTIPLRHRVGNLVWRNIFNLLFNTDLKDTNCGFIAMNRDVAKAVTDTLGGGYIIENVLLIEALKQNLRIKQVKVSVNYKKLSAIPRGVRTVLGVLVFIFNEGIRYRLGSGK